MKNKEKLITAQTDCEIPGLQTAANFFRYPLQDPIPLLMSTAFVYGIQIIDIQKDRKKGGTLRFGCTDTGIQKLLPCLLIPQSSEMIMLMSALLFALPLLCIDVTTFLFLLSLYNKKMTKQIKN